MTEIMRSVDIWLPNSTTVTTPVQNDAGSRFVGVQLTAEGKPYSVPSNATLMLAVRKPDETVTLTAAQAVDNKVVAELTNQTLAVSGIADAQIIIYAGESVLRTPPFKLRVLECIITDGVIESTDEFSALTELLNNYSIDSTMSQSSKHPLENQVITNAFRAMDNRKLNKAGDTMSGALNMDGNKITNLPTPQQDGDAVPKNYVDRIPTVNVDYALSGTSRNPVQNKIIKEALDSKLNKAGDSVSGNLNFGKKYGLYQVNSITIESEEEGTGGIGMKGNPITGLPTPKNKQDAANKEYVDDTAAALKNEQGGLIYSTTLSEDVKSIIISQTNGNESFALKELYLTIKIPASTGLQSFAYISAILHITANRKSNVVKSKTVISGGTDGKYHNVMFKFSLKNMRWEYSTGTTLNAELKNEYAEAKLENIGYVLNDTLASYDELKCDTISLSPTGATANFPTGTIIEVYGI